ncbi:stage VI sporulation protein D [Robertmurraya kyonggiensis]|uniref:Stage VI sporulation protein D n=1 Tax=Robertmurraya kyonggiensis TaxID=1037680 RepID=A0A4U1D1G9_9BACI|nr:stage VI sporulation protein D [Robertmurraya kyonggiensis]TKC15638.1 stage VI sporulation protein D [Robertmurraya kyonggiensis]
MSEGNESFLRFSLEESVWFQKGQEVAELITISLDPNITIHENEQYVTIEGALQLTGEYKRHSVDVEEEEFPASPKFIQQVEERGEGVTEFSHRFPVDITIPQHRIASIYDLDVEIESFDYAFPERSCMKLTADLTITGLKGDDQKEEVEVEEEVQVQEFAFRGPEVNQPESVAEEVQEFEETVPPTAQLFKPFEVEARKTSGEPEEESTPIEFEQDSIPTLQVFQSEKPDYPDISFSAQRSEYGTNAEANLNQPAVEEAEIEYEEPSFEEEAPAAEEVETKKKKKKSKKQGISITEFLARKEIEEDVAKLRVCIVQNGDTLDVLAERYDISVQQLLKVNHLEVNQDVYEGQVLYIPATVAHN